MRVKIAERVFEFIGCDAMHNAAYFTHFLTDADHVDCRVEVTVQETACHPSGIFPESIGDWMHFAVDGGRQICHRSRNVLLTINDSFSQIQLTLSSRMTELDTVMYLQVQQAVCGHLLLHDAAMIHSAGLSVNGEGVLLCGRSGVGKSTMARLMQEVDPSVDVLCEEMPALTCSSDGFCVHGSPFCGGDALCSNAHAPLKAVVLLRKATDNRIVTPSKEEAMFELLGVLSRPSYIPRVAAAATDLAVAMTTGLPIVLFDNNGTLPAAQMLLEYLHTEPRESI